MNFTMNTITTLLLVFFLTTSSLSLATRPDPTTLPQTQPKPSKDNKPHKSNNNNNKGGGGNDGGFNIPGFGSGNIPGIGGNIPGFGGGYGSGFGGPSGGYSKGGVIRPTVVCKDKGPCYKKKLTCPAKCFTSYSRSGKGYGGGGGGGSCTMDCKKCVAYC